MKRFVDWIVIVGAAPFWVPLIAIVALLVRIRIGSPVLFSQMRVGLEGKPFRLYKFRTMTNALDGDGQLLPDDQRLVPFGSMLRRCSLDELPCLFNLIRGDITLVGPRPLLVDYVPMYTPEQARRHEIRPGITGWAQVSGRNAVDWERRLELDVWYVDNHGFWLDVYILALTVLRVLRQEGISAEGQVTMRRFEGQDSKRTLAIVGASGHGKVVADAALKAGWRRILFFDDRWPGLTTAGEWSVIGNTAAVSANRHRFAGVIVAIGICTVRDQVQKQLKTLGLPLATVIHPAASVSERARVGEGCFVAAGAVVGVDAELGDACIINTGATIDHDCTLHAGVHVAPGANLGGAVVVGERSWVGIGATVRQCIKIGSSVVIGAGAVVVHDVPDNQTVIGNPAKSMPMARQSREDQTRC